MAPAWLKAISSKLAILIANLGKLRSMDALVVAERTSTLLKRLPIKTPAMIHIPHGAGDRARSYDKRIALFDHVIVAGPKDKRRMIELGLVTDESCSVSGYIKAAALKAMTPQRPKLFKNDRPTVLYNPHFSGELSSWPVFGQDVLEHFVNQSRYNLIFAPHIRMFAGAAQTERQAIDAYDAHDHIHIDLGSDRSTDMTYTRAADIYLGDVSSQVYEFLLSPGPCLFLSREKFNWQDDPDFAHWRYGQVCHDLTEFKSALALAEQAQERFLPIQITGRDDALGDQNWDALTRAAQAISQHS